MILRWILSRLPKRTIFVNGTPYLTRYFLQGSPEDVEVGDPPGVYIHHFHASDTDRELHNHPWTGWSLILKGGYVEERREDIGTSSCPGVYSAPTTRKLTPGCINHIGLEVFHRATLLDERRGAWTLFFTGERVRDWGFLDPDTLAFKPHKSNRCTVPPAGWSCSRATGHKGPCAARSSRAWDFL